MGILVFDTETTGLVPGKDRVIEFGAVAFSYDGEVLGRLGKLINPQRPIPWESTRIHGITDQMVRQDGSLWEQVAETIFKWMDSADVWCGHNLGFDTRFMTSEFERLGMPMPEKPEIDTMTVAQRFIPSDRLKSKRLGRLAEFYGISLSSAHRAVHDSEATGELLFAMSEDLDLSIAELISSDVVSLGKYHIGSDPFLAQVAGHTIKH